MANDTAETKDEKIARLQLANDKLVQQRRELEFEVERYQELFFYMHDAYDELRRKVEGYTDVL